MRIYKLLSILCIPTVAWAEGPVVNKQVCQMTWTAPTQKTDGSVLKDLREYRVYTAKTLTGKKTMTVVPTKTSSPAANTEVKQACTALTPGQYFYWVTAVDKGGNESRINEADAIPFVVCDCGGPGVAGSTD